MRDTTTIYLLDHPSGYEWRYQLGDLFQEFYEQVQTRISPREEPFTSCHGIWILEVPAHLTTSGIEDYLQRCNENWVELDGKRIWKPGEGIPINVYNERERQERTAALVDTMYRVIVAMASQVHMGISDANLTPEGEGVIRFSTDLLATADDEDELSKLMWTFWSMLTALRALDPDVGVWFQTSLVFTVGGGR